MPTLARTIILFSALIVPTATFADAAADLGARIASQGTPKGVAPCIICHGADGGGMAPTGYPRLAGLNAEYTARQLRDFRTGKRNNPVMAPMAANLTDDEIAAVSAYYAVMPVPAPVGQAPAEDAATIATNLVQYGDLRERGLPGCVQCHGPDGNGIGAGFPGIAGQQGSYIEAQLKAWKGGTRSNDPFGLMKTVADRLTDAEIEAVAAYYASLPGAASTAAANALTLVPGDVEVAPGDVHPGAVTQQGAPPPGRNPDAAGYFAPPARDALPDGPFGEVVARGQAVFENTNAHPVSSKYVGNDQACGNCHIDAGRLAQSAPLWASWAAYPAYRAKNKKVNTYIERIQGCFDYSMNARASSAGGPPAADSDAIVSLVAYSYWLAKGAPTGDDAMPGRGYQRLQETEQGFDPERGVAVYAAKCALCHGDDGAGVAFADGRTLFPPLWGAGSYNWGAGMHRIDTAAAFIKHNMPLGLGGSLSDQEAWDLAAYMNSRERPQDPRYQGDLAATTEQFHGNKFDYYGKRKGADGELLGERPAIK